MPDVRNGRNQLKSGPDGRQSNACGFLDEQTPNPVAEIARGQALNQGPRKAMGNDRPPRQSDTAIRWPFDGRDPAELFESSVKVGTEHLGPESLDADPCRTECGIAIPIDLDLACVLLSV